jgi:peptidyl-tRNA hydrolase, PTH1 family
LKLIVGLGNPGRAYANTRHNVGFQVIDTLAKSHHIKVIRRYCRALVGVATISGEEVILAKPQTFMKLPGQAVGEISRKQRIDPSEILVIYDDMDLPPGKLRIRLGGSSGGHKGMRSIIDHLGTKDFPRIRIGIGRHNGEAVDHVLSRFTRAELQLVRPAIQSAAEAIEVMLEEGIEPAMNRFNG